MHSSPSLFAQNLKHLRRVKIGIRAEDPNRIWERRTPLTPEAVYNLVQSGRANVEVVTSPKRIFPDKEYVKAGASIVHSLTNSDIVLGIKEPPLKEIDAFKASPNVGRQTHLMFSHTIKGQPYNTPLLAKYVSPSYSPNNKHYPRLVDYELITNESDGKRTVGFGWFAGVAGVLEALSSMAHSHLKLGYASPFLYTPRPHTLPSLENLQGALHDIGSIISADGTPPDLGPFIIGLTGNGQVSRGCLAMLSELPIQKVKAEELASLFVKWEASELDLRKIYLVHAQPEDYLVRVDGGKYDRAHYYQSPQSYVSVFGEKIAPYLTLFLNGAGWSPSFPRLMTNAQLEVALARAQDLGGARFTNVADISCDVKGGLEFLSQATTMSSPSYEERPEGLPANLPSVQMMAVDILPASIPLDASMHFSKALEGHLSDLVDYHTQQHTQQQGTESQTLFPTTLERATVAAQGKLRGPHEWLQRAVDQYYSQPKESTSTTSTTTTTMTTVQTPTEESESSAGAKETNSTAATTTGGGKRKRILILGSGMVAGPAVDLIAQSPNIDLVIASDSAAELQRLVRPHTSVKYRIIDADTQNTYAPLVRDADVVISLLPAHMHSFVAETCIRGNSHLITASYMSEDIARLDDFAKSTGILILTEMGLDPGLDHCSAMDMLHKIGRNQESVVSFTSFCGGIPVPEDSNVPLRYKFSWRPQGVLTAALNNAIYLLDKQIYEIPGSQLLQSHFPNLPITKEFELEGLPNRDSLAYKSFYRIPNKIVYSDRLRTFLRGTLRYPGFSSLMNSFAALGLLNTSHRIKLKSWHSLVDECLAIKQSQGLDNSLFTLIRQEDLEPLRDALEWLGLAEPPMRSLFHESSGPMPPIPQDAHKPLDLFAFLLSQKLKYAPDERDMVVLSHEIITTPTTGTGRHPDSQKWDEKTTMVHSAKLIVKGTTEHNVGFVGERPASAMARTVGLPVAIAAMLVAEGKIKDAGVIRPTEMHVFKPILEGLDRVGICVKDEVRSRKAVRSYMGRTVEDALVESVALRSKPGRDRPTFRESGGDRTWMKDQGAVFDPLNLS